MAENQPDTADDAPTLPSSNNRADPLHVTLSSTSSSSTDDNTENDVQAQDHSNVVERDTQTLTSRLSVPPSKPQRPKHPPSKSPQQPRKSLSDSIAMTPDEWFKPDIRRTSNRQNRSKSTSVRPRTMYHPQSHAPLPENSTRATHRSSSFSLASGETSKISPMLSRRSCFLSPSIVQGHYRIGRGEQRMLDWLRENGRFDLLSGQTTPDGDASDTGEISDPQSRASSPRHHPAAGPQGSSSATLRTSMIATMMGVRHSANELRRAELVWQAPPTSVLIIYKPNDEEVLQCALQVIEFILKTRSDVCIRVQESAHSKVLYHLNQQAERIKVWIPVEDPWDCAAEEGSIVPEVDLVITLGGDGTLLYTANLFQLMAPPILSFALGSLGFLTPFDFKNYQQHLNDCFDGRAIITLRTRLECEIIRSPDSIVKIDPDSNPVWNVLNEVVIDRGPAAYISKLDVYCDGHPITCVQGDGLIIATPTGSTAYSVSAGGSMVHPTVPCMLMTPICPHSLSFRPIIMPATVELKVVCNPSGQTGAWVSMDGKNRQELGVGDGIRITTSVWPIPTVAKQDISRDWFDSLAMNLNWNIREMQKTNSKQQE